MKFLLLNQTFYPDVVSTAQHLTDLAVRLAERGHEVTVLAGRRAYDQPDRLFPKRETWRGVRILRVGCTGFGKSAKWRRAADFASFLFLCCLRLLFLPRFDVVIALTSPPLISFVGACLAKLKRSRFIYWVMDLNPDEAIVAGWLGEHSLAANVLGRMSCFSLRRADRVIALDRFMRERILAKGVSGEKVAVIPPWSHDEHVFYDAPGRESFRRAHTLEGKFVVMYSGNHSPCHPLDTLLAAARRLSHDPGIVFCFVGGGSEYRKIEAEVRATTPANILCLPYQPLERLAASLSAADLHVVVMGDAFVGTIHPCKIYNILGVGAPVLYIGPQPSHLSDILQAADGSFPFASAGHGEVDKVVRAIQRLRSETKGIPRAQPLSARSKFSKESLLPRLVGELEAQVVS